MFTIVISEKGGAERRETFDKNEINVGRVQGNDLMLPKGNVSKQHARLLYRDGRFIVTDLKSTNGTYVNGRKIAQATIVRDGDKIYIGDFVLKVETGQGSQAAPKSAENASAAAVVVEEPPASRGVPRVPTAAIQPSPVHLAAAAPVANGPAPPMPTARMVEGGALAERDAEGAREKISATPAPERAAKTSGRGSQIPGAPRGRGASPANREGRAAGVNAVAPGSTRGGVGGVASQRPLPRETPQQAARRLALVALVDRVTDSLGRGVLDEALFPDDALTKRIERAAQEQAKAMRSDGEVPEELDLELLVRDALRELLSFGPIGPLLEDDEVYEIQALRHDYVLALRASGPGLAEVSFTSDAAFARAIRRLVGPRWTGDEGHVSHRLPNGAELISLGPPLAAGHVLTIRKRRRVDTSVEELVRLGGLSRPMATFLEQCLHARANLLVVGTGAGAIAGLLAALAAAGPAADRVALVHERAEPVLHQTHAVSLALPENDARAADVIRAAARLGTDRLIIGALVDGAVAATMEAISSGARGVLAGAQAPSLRQGLARLVTQLAAARPGVGIDVAREWIASSFDVGIEVTRLADGRFRVLRIGELAGVDAGGIRVNDLFSSSVEGANGDGAFVASGVVPNLASDFAARGVPMDPNLFKRSVGRGG